MIDQYKHQQLRIGPISLQQIRTWANKILPNGEVVGEVTKPYTFHYKTNKPETELHAPPPKTHVKAEGIPIRLNGMTVSQSESVKCKF